MICENRSRSGFITPRTGPHGGENAVVRSYETGSRRLRLQADGFERIQVYRTRAQQLGRKDL